MAKKKKQAAVDEDLLYTYDSICEPGVYRLTSSPPEDGSNGEYLVAFGTRGSDEIVSSFLFVITYDTRPPVIYGTDYETILRHRGSVYERCPHLRFTGMVMMKEQNTSD